MCRLFGHGVGAEPEYAGIVFFKITSARSRLVIVEKLLRKRLGDRYNSSFWNPLFRDLKLIDEKRNQIVHWTTVVEIGGGPPTAKLVPPNLYEIMTTLPQAWDAGRLEDFTHQCDYYTRLLNVFESAEFGNHLPPGIRQSWREICQQPPAYPPPDSHPLSRNYKGP